VTLPVRACDSCRDNDDGRAERGGVLAPPPRRRLRRRRQLLRLRRDVGSPAPSSPCLGSRVMKGKVSGTLDAHLQTCLLVRYPVPQRSETRGRSEELLGRWLRARRAPRDSVVVATKVSKSPQILPLLRLLVCIVNL
jgi:hypothetical protein